MIRLNSLIILAFLLATANASSTGMGTEDLQTVAGYQQKSFWWQSNMLPRWNDTYVVVFEQEMLA